MTLYLEPPTGNISLHKLETFAVKRLELLMKVQAARGDVCRLQQVLCDQVVVAGSDCLIVGSTKDKVSHFILRLLVGGDPEMRSFFSQAETTLFDCHFSCMSEEEMNRFFHKVNRQIMKANIRLSNALHPTDFCPEDVMSILAVFHSIKKSAALSWEDIVRFYLSQSTKTFCIPFQSVLNLVGRRDVVLEKGMAKVPLCKLREVVSEQFLSLMKIVSRQAASQHEAALSDERMRLLWRKLKHLYRSKAPGAVSRCSTRYLSLKEVDTMADSYPLCMATLLRSLRRKHRLGHKARIQLTLFLKEMGLPVHHALALWQGEYSRPPGPGSRCGHSWQEDSRRYTYSIRHLYGLEGARRNYRGHCCQSLQQTVLGCNEEGGCPFVHWDDATLSAELSNKTRLQGNQLSEILRLCNVGQFSAACQSTLHPPGSVKTLHSAHVREEDKVKDNPVRDMGDSQSRSSSDEPCKAGKITLTGSPIFMKVKENKCLNDSFQGACESASSERKVESNVLGPFSALPCFSEMKTETKLIDSCYDMGLTVENFPHKMKNMRSVPEEFCACRDDQKKEDVKAVHVQISFDGESREAQLPAASSEGNRNRSATNGTVENVTFDAGSVFTSVTVDADAKDWISAADSCHVCGAASTAEHSFAQTTETDYTHHSGKRQKLSHSCQILRLNTQPSSRNLHTLDPNIHPPGTSPHETAGSIESCFEHDVCPSQVSEKRTELHQPQISAQMEILKPVDYFLLSYKQLLDGLQ